jgi:nicotinate-nucleotide adenylyltransferase
VATVRSASNGRRRAARRAAGIGILGGTFDPVHLAHLRVAEEIRETQRLAEVRLVPSAIPPHKTRRPVTAARHRLAMVERAVAGHRGLAAWDVELRRAGPSYSVDTLRALRAERGPQVRLVFALGWDAFTELDTWKEYREIFGLCDVVVVTRPAHPPRLSLDDFPVAARKTLLYDRRIAGFRHVSGHEVTLQRVTALDVSATDIRARVRAGRSIAFLVPESVRRYIHDHALYGPTRRNRTA